MKKSISKKLLMLLSFTMVVSLFALGTANGEDGTAGSSKGADGKGQLIMNIEQSPNLNDQQRADLKEEAKAANTEADFEKIGAKAAELSASMTELRKVVTVGEISKEEANYKSADTKLQENYENQLSIGSNLVAKGGPGADNEFVRNVIGKIVKAEGRLNGKANQKSVAEGRQAVLEAANSSAIINDNQKERIAAKADAARTEARCRTLKGEVLDLKAAMEGLEREVIRSASVKGKAGYLDARHGEKAAYDDAVTEAKAILKKDGPGVNDEYVRNLLKELKAERENFEGK